MADQLKAKDYEKIGRVMENVVLAGYASKRRLFTTNFLRGIFFGMGSALGATLILTVVIYLLTLFSELPLVGEVFQKAQTTIEDSTE